MPLPMHNVKNSASAARHYSANQRPPSVPSEYAAHTGSAFFALLLRLLNPFITRWRIPQPKAPHRKYLNDAGSPLVSCGVHARGQWLLEFADQTTRITTIRPTPEMVAIHNATQAKAARARAHQPVMTIEPPKSWT
jgi:hypothetical protein